MVNTLSKHENHIKSGLKLTRWQHVCAFLLIVRPHDANSITTVKEASMVNITFCPISIYIGGDTPTSCVVAIKPT